MATSPSEGNGHRSLASERVRSETASPHAALLRAPSGISSAASLAFAFVGLPWAGAFEGAALNFVVSIVSGGLFGIGCTLEFGPIEA